MNAPGKPARALLGWTAMLAWAATAPAPAPALAADDPRALLDETAAAYRALPSYADRGEFRLVLVVDGKPHAAVQPASITLARPDRLKVEAGLARLVCDGETLTTLVGPTRKYATAPAPKALGIHHVTEGPVGSLLIGGPAGPPLLMVLGLLLGDDPARGVLDVGGALSIGPDVVVDGRACRALRVEAPGGTAYRLAIDPETKLLRAIDVTLAPDALAALLPLGDRARVETYRWSAGAVSTTPPDADAFAIEVPKDFARLGAVEPRRDDEGEAAKSAVHELVDKPSPEFTLTVLDGPGKTRTVSRADLAGKVVMIDFWATWCGPCLAELPEVQKLVESYAKAGKDVVIVALSQDNDPKDPAEVRKLVEATLEKKGIRLAIAPVGRVAIDPSNTVGGAFRVEGYPTVVLIDREGVVRAAHVGFTPDVGEALGREIDALLEGKPIGRPKG